MGYSPFRTSDSTVDRNLDAIATNLTNLSKSVPEVSKCITYTMKIRGSSSDPIKGGVVLDRAQFSRMADKLIGRYDFSQTSAGAAGSGLYLFDLPVGLDIDPLLCFSSSEAGLGVVGPAQINIGGAAYNGICVTASGNSFSLKMQDPTAGSGSLFDVNATNTGLNNAQVNFSFTFSVPILQWR